MEDRQVVQTAGVKQFGESLAEIPEEADTKQTVEEVVEGEKVGEPMEETLEEKRSKLQAGQRKN